MHTFTVNSPGKRVNIISINDVLDQQGKVVTPKGLVMRTSRRYAGELIASGNFAPTSKSKLKSFLNKSIKLHRNEKAIVKTEKLTKVQYYKTEDGKHYADIGKPNIKTGVHSRQYVVTRFPKY